jgi:hypothetical protein
MSALLLIADPAAAAKEVRHWSEEQLRRIARQADCFACERRLGPVRAVVPKRTSDRVTDCVIDVAEGSTDIASRVATRYSTAMPI